MERKVRLSVLSEAPPPPKRNSLRAKVRLCFLMALVLAVSRIPVSALEVTVSIQNDWPVDIVLCAGDTNKDLDKFKEQLTAALVAAGVDEFRLNITASETKSYTSIGDGLNVIKNTWTKFPSGAADAFINNGGLLRGPYGPGSTMQGYLNGVDEETSDWASATLTFAGWCSYCPAGVTSRIHKNSNGTYDMLFASLEGTSPECRVILYKVTNINLQNQPYVCGQQGFSRVPNARIVATGPIFNSGFYDKYDYTNDDLPISNRIVLQMTSKKDSHEVFVNNRLAITYTDSSIPEGSMAYAASYTRHTGIESAEFEIGSVTPLIEAVRSPNYTSGSSRFIVDVCDTPREDFGNVEMVGELTQRMQADNAYYIGWGQNDSKVSIENFIKHNNGNGTYLRNTDSDIYQQTAKYIEPIVNKILTGKDTEYLLKDYSYGFTQTYN